MYTKGVVGMLKVLKAIKYLALVIVFTVLIYTFIYYSVLKI